MPQSPTSPSASPSLPPRSVAIIPAEGGGWCIQLDGTMLHTPRRALVVLPTRALAELMAAEWRQESSFSALKFPFTALAFSALDVLPLHRDKMADAMLAYAETDLLLYRSETPDLRARQDEGWDPVLRWVEQRYRVLFRATAGVMPITQPDETLATLRAVLIEMDSLMMAGFSPLVQALGSLTLALAVMERALEPAHAFRLSRVDEDYQAEKWGEESTALARAKELERDVVHAARWLAALG